jgi:hypothetical protein
MPEGYYSGDKPNPNLRDFVEAHVKERPYNPATDDYNIPAFSQPIETTKATAIYNMHTYWSKKPHDAIRQYIRHYTQPGDLVLDPFCGSGGTALAALMEGRKAIAIDRSPAATFITKNYCTPVDVEELQAAFEELKRRVKPEIDWLYETRCDRCGGKATTAYTVYSQVFQCTRCLRKVPLFDCREAISETRDGRPKKVNACPYCYENGIVEEISTRGERFGAVPVLVSYLCESGCRPVRGERKSAKEDAAASSVGSFISGWLKKHPGHEGVHYSDIFEHYVYTVTDKPRRQLQDWLSDYFYITPEGTYRLPADEEEKRVKEQGRASGTNRRIKRYISYLRQGLVMPENERPSNATMIEWIRHCKQSGLYDQGVFLYERGGLNIDALPEEVMVRVEEDYQVCKRILEKEHCIKKD